MKREGYIFDKICEIENIKLAIVKSSKGKRHQRRVQNIFNDQDKYAKKIQILLKEKKYIHAPYKIKNIKDGVTKKERTIHMPRYYPDQIIHWALMIQIEHILMRGMYDHCCGSVPNKGTTHGQKNVRQWLNTDSKNTKYCLKLDIKKFYPTIKNEILKNQFRKKIKDRDCLWLIDKIIDTNDGLPIGNYTSQWFSNFYLEGLDNYIKQELKIKYYVRYVDDLVMFGPNKKKLHIANKGIDNFLSSLGLTIKKDWQVFPVKARPIDFLGLKFYRNKTILRKSNALRIKRRIKKISNKSYLNFRDASAVISYWGWIKRSDSFHFYNKNIKPYISIGKTKKAVSDYAKIRENRKW